MPALSALPNTDAPATSRRMSRPDAGLATSPTLTPADTGAAYDRWGHERFGTRVGDYTPRRADHARRLPRDRGQHGPAGPRAGAPSHVGGGPERRRAPPARAARPRPAVVARRPAR